LTESTWVKFNSNHTISGAVTGTWKLYDKYRAELTIDNEGTYDGVFIRQYDPTSGQWVMTFSAMSDEGIVIWGSHVDTSSDKELVQAIKQELGTSFPDTVISDLELPSTATRGAKITWESSNPEAVSTEGVVTRPSYDAQDALVELTAKITLGDATETLTITVTVTKKAEGGLAAFYDFNDSFKDRSGTNKTDAAVTGDRINIQGGQITFAEGKVGQAAKFDGNSGLRLDDGLITGNTYSVSLWLKPEQLTEFTTSFFGAKTANNWISVVPKTGWGNTMVWSHNGDQWYDAVTDRTIPVGEWSHLTLTVKEGDVVFYVNGVAKYTGTNFPNVFTSIDAEFGLGVNYWDTPFKGLIDEVRVYDGLALPANEVQSLYQNPAEE
jgi:arabinan endo-1,5-alpha-L-arabinosidase